MNSGAVVSETSMVWVALVVLPHPSSAVNVRTKVKALAQSPAMVSFTTVMVASPQLSDAEAASSTNSSEHSAL